MKFRIGDRVKFKKRRHDIFNFKCEEKGIPDKLITHGDTSLDMEIYDKKGGLIKYVWENYYLVEFQMESENSIGTCITVLGYLEEELIKIGRRKMRL